MICSCGLRVPTTPANYVGTMVSDDCVLLLFNCACESTRATPLWQSESFARDTDEPLAAE